MKFVTVCKRQQVSQINTATAVQSNSTSRGGRGLPFELPSAPGLAPIAS